MPFTDEELKKIKAELPRGACKKLAHQLNMHEGSVRKILSGLRFNDEVVVAAHEMAQEYQEKLNQVKKQLAV